MTTIRQFRDLPEEDRVSTFERLFRVALESFLPDLASAPWHVREREVVNCSYLATCFPNFKLKNLTFAK